MRHPNSKIPPISKDTPIGKRIKTVLEPRFNGKKVVLESVGTLDIQEKIESFAPFADINYMLHRLKVGDRSVISANLPIYGDFSALPTNPVDVINLVHSAEATFSELDLDTKKSFNNDWRVWLASLFNNSGVNSGNGTVGENGTVVKPVPDPVPDLVPDPVSKEV